LFDTDRTYLFVVRARLVHFLTMANRFNLAAQNMGAASAFPFDWPPVLHDTDIPLPARTMFALPAGGVPQDPAAYTAAAMMHLGTQIFMTDLTDNKEICSTRIEQ